jgi:SAM-dependent methyltransferase
MTKNTLLSDIEVEEFIKNYDSTYNGELSSLYNYSRVVSLAHFQKYIKKYNLEFQDKIGVISGSDAELELRLLSYKSLKVLSYEVDQVYDLDLNWNCFPSENFSLTLCNQVLEHVFNPHQAIKNLIHHTKSQGYIYITIPTVNCIHGEPHFFSSGFHPRFLERLGKENELEIVDLGWWGSYKYMVNAVSKRWLSANHLKPGIHHKRDLRLPFLLFKDGTKRDKKTEPVISDCWALFKKKY